MHLPNLNSSSNKAFKKSPSQDPPSYNESVSSSPISLTPQNSRSRVPTMNSIGTSSSTSLSSGKKKKNVPYRPTPEQQRQIDLLTNPSSSSSSSSLSSPPPLSSSSRKKSLSSKRNGDSGSATPVAALSTVSSHAQTEYFDVLPSFQMFQSILKRDDRQFREDLSSLPPVYGDITNSSPTPPSLSPQPSRDVNNSTNSTIDEVVNRLNEYGLAQERDDAENDEYLFEDNENINHQNGRNELLPIGSNINTQVHNQNVDVTHETYGHSPLDNIDKLRKLPHSPIDIQIYVTKQIPQPNVTNELETRLKEYTSGDFVNGYVTVTNTSDEPVQFGLFTVSLEGTIKEVERNPNAVGLNHKFLKILMKKFLKMYDLNASYGYVAVPNSAGIEYEVFSNDAADGTIMGLPDDRILQPNVKYKKFFTFKFPHRLLDNACVNSLLPHLLPPPSMGVDRTCFYNRGESIQLNKALGYGFLNVRGTPLLTKDYSFDDLSVSYTIEAKFIDRLNSEEPFSHDEINKDDQESEYAISKSSQYFLRFIPDLKEQVEYCKKFHVGGYPVNGVGGKFMQQYLKKLTWKDIQLQNLKIEHEIDEKLTKMEFTADEIKDKNLIIHDNNNSPLDHLDIKRSGDFDESEPHRNYIHNKIPIEVFGKKKKMILSSLVKIGQLTMYVEVPDQVIPYSSPRLLMKYNNGSRDDLTPENSLRPSISHMDELYNRSEEDLIDTLKLKLEFISSDSNIRAPQIQSVYTNLVFWSYSSEYPLPFEIGYDFFYTNPENQDEFIRDPVEITKNNLQIIKDQVSNYISFVKDNKISLSRDGYLYLKAIKTLGVKKDTVKDYFQTIVDPNILNHEGDWKVRQLNNKSFQYTKDLEIPLITVNKNNVNLLPSFQSCLVGRIYCLQVAVRYKGTNNDQDEYADNIVKVDIPILVG